MKDKGILKIKNFVPGGENMAKQELIRSLKSRIITLLKPDMLPKSRILLGVVLILYLSFIVYFYQSSITEGDKHNHDYEIGIDDLTTREVAVTFLVQTLIVFIIPISIVFILKNRILIYSLALLTYILPIIINSYLGGLLFWIYIMPIVMIIGIDKFNDFSLWINNLHLEVFFFLIMVIPIAIPICLTLYWELKRKATGGA